MSYDAPSPYPAQQPQQQPYGQPPQAGHNPYGGATYDTAASSQAYAHWGRRVGSSLLDALVWLVPYVAAIVFFVLSREETVTRTFLDANGREVPVATDVSFGGPMLVLSIVMVALTVAVWFWNVVWRQGRTGRTVGKGVMGTTLVAERTGQPVGAGMSFVRQLCHVLDGFFYLGYLWPLWDAKRQTFADKIVGSVVLSGPAR